jgi:hypothetical protein
MREKNSNLSALHRQMGFQKKKSRLISLEEETRAFNKLGKEKREEHLSIDISVENSKLVETDNNMVVAPSFQAATKHRIGQSVNLPGASLRTVSPVKERREKNRKKRELRLLRFQPTSNKQKSLISDAIVKDNKRTKKMEDERINNKKRKKKKKKKSKEERGGAASATSCTLALLRQCSVDAAQPQVLHPARHCVQLPNCVQLVQLPSGRPLHMAETSFIPGGNAKTKTKTPF